MSDFISASVWNNKDGQVDPNPTTVDIPVNFDQGSVYNPNGFDFYSVQIAGKQRTGSILLPPVSNDGEKFPVLYLLNGQGGNGEWQNDSVGRIQFIMGYLWANNILKRPYIVVMPDVFAPNSVSDVQKMHDYQALESILPPTMDYIVNNYPALGGKDNSAIAGLSMGGVASLYLGFKLQDRFCSIGSFSPVSFLFISELGWLNPDTIFKFGNGNDHFIFVGKGLQDPTANGYPDFYMKKLNGFGNDNTFCTVPGAHCWQETGYPGPFRSLLYVYLLNDMFS